MAILNILRYKLEPYSSRKDRHRVGVLGEFPDRRPGGPGARTLKELKDPEEYIEKQMRIWKFNTKGFSAPLFSQSDQGLLGVEELSRDTHLLPSLPEISIAPETLHKGVVQLIERKGDLTPGRINGSAAMRAAIQEKAAVEGTCRHEC